MVSPPSIPPYLNKVLDLIAREMPLPTEGEFARFINIVCSSPERLQKFTEAWEELVRYGDQDWLWDAHRTRGFNRECRPLGSLLILFDMLGMRGLLPFSGLQHRPDVLKKLKRADYIPPEIQPFIDFGTEATTACDELELIETLDRLPSHHLARLLELRQRRSDDASLKEALRVWLRHKPDAIEVEIVQRVLGMMEWLDYRDL